MKALRISASILTLATLSLLAACGGGGGGGGNTNPIPQPSNQPTTHPTTSPTTAPSTNPTSTPSGSVAVDSAHTVSAEENFVNGAQGWYTSGTASWSNNAGDDSSSTAPTTTGASFDSMTCDNTVEGSTFPSTAYSQHAFVGIFNATGAEMAVPQAIGMVNPVAPTAGNPAHPTNNYEVENYQCEYNLHTHDYSGLVHLEDINAPQNTSYSFAPTWGTLGSLLDLWGATITASGLTAGGSSLSGAVTIYTGTPSSTVGGVDYVTSYTQYSGDPRALVLTRHEAVWIVVGTTAGNIPPPSGTSGTNGLPQVKFVIVN